MYDPLLDRHPGQGQAYPDSYWSTTVSGSDHYPRLDGDNRTEVAVIGGGYTGLSCALQLARRGVDVTLLEANQLGWGCSGRNAGFVLTGSGRLGLAQLQQRFGTEQGQAVYAEYQAAVDLVGELIAEGNIDAEVQSPGYYKVAHSKRWVAPMRAQQKLLGQVGEPVRWLDKEELEGQLGHVGAHGALKFERNYGVNPLKLALGYAGMAAGKGARLFAGSPVLAIKPETQWHRLCTPNGSVLARHLVLAGNGYTPRGLHRATEGRTLPVLSSIIVTQPFDGATLAAVGLHSTSVVMDTRALKYYYRRLPDGRILFGGRGAITGRNADKAVFQQRLLEALCQAYPGLPSPRIDYAWSGWISVSLDDLPRIHSPGDGVHYATGYCGSGVAFAALAGKRLAQGILGDPLPPLELYRTPLKPFPLVGISRSLGRIGQWGYYHYGRLVDAL